MKTILDRFNNKYIPVTESGCWLWIGSINARGYGDIRIDGKSLKAHRVSYILFNGDIPNGLYVCHKCDERACVNPDHLWLGTQSDNLKDSYNKQRKTTQFSNLMGELHYASRFTNRDILQVRAMSEVGSMSALQIAKVFKVCKSTILNILNYRTWKHVV